MKVSSGTRRTSRMASLIRSELARVLIEEVSDPGLRSVVITEVDLSADLKNARVFYTRGQSDPKEIDRGFHRAVPFLKRRLGDSLQLKYVPTLEFKVDEHGERLGQLMQAFDAIKERP